jgi:uncharacterized membrane protein
MSATFERPSTNPTRSSLLLLLLALVFALMIMPALEQAFRSRVFICAGVTAVLVFGVFVNQKRRRLFIVYGIFSAIAISVTWTTLFVDHASLFVISCILEGLFYAAIAVMLLIGVLRRRWSEIDSVFGAVCVYLLLGLCWAQLYWATERLDGESLSVAGQVIAGRSSDPDSIAAFSDMVYFSFVTMSTLGYGDITPETPAAKTLTWMQSVLGQFYLAVLVAWLVNSIPRSRETETCRSERLTDNQTSSGKDHASNP